MVSVRLELAEPVLWRVRDLFLCDCCIVHMPPSRARSQSVEDGDARVADSAAAAHGAPRCRCALPLNACARVCVRRQPPVNVTSSAPVLPKATEQQKVALPVPHVQFRQFFQMPSFINLVCVRTCVCARGEHCPRAHSLRGFPI